WQTRRARVEGSAVYLSFARLGASRPPQDVQVETHLSQVGGASLSRSRGRANGTENPVGCHPWRENEEGVKIIPAQNYAGIDNVIWITRRRSHRSPLRHFPFRWKK